MAEGLYIFRSGEFDPKTMPSEPAPTSSFYESVKGLFLKLEVAYLTVLPFLGAVAAFYFETPWTTYIILGGWLLAMMNMYIHVPMAMSGYRRKGARLILPLASTGLIALKNGLHSGNIWDFFLDQAVMESAALMLGFALIFLFSRGMNGDTAFEALGPGMVIFVVALFVGSAGGLLLAWVERLALQPQWSIVNYSIAIILATYHKVTLVKGIRDGEFNPDKQYSKNFFPLIIVTFAWIFGLGILKVVLYG